MRSFRPLLVSAILTCFGPLVARAATIPVTSNITTNTTWTNGNVYWVQNSIGVNAGVTLTVQPGVVVKFTAGRSFTVNGNLRCIGDPVLRITFTSIRDDNVGGDTNGDGNATVPAASDWIGINWPDASPDFGSRLHETDVQFAGGGNVGALVFASSSDSVTNCNVRRSYYGIDCAGTAAPILVNTSIEASTQTPVVLDFTATPQLSSLVFSSANNGYDAFGLRGATLTSGTSATLPRRGATVGASPIANVTYVLFGSLTINAGASLTIAPGVVIKPTGGQIIDVSGNLTMNGTAAVGDEIVITSIHDDNYGLPADTNNNGSITAPAPNNWGYVYFRQGATGSVQYARLKFATTSSALGTVTMFNNSIGVSNCTISDQGHGLAILGVSNPAITSVAINNGSTTPILMSVSANPTFSGITFLANAITALGLQGESIAVDSHIFFRTVAGYTNITYYVMNAAVHMLSPAILTIDPGVVIKNELNGGGFVIDGGLIADGTPASPIVFTSVRDDTWGNPLDTNGDGSITVPAQGNWTNIHFNGTADDAHAVLDNCRIIYGSSQPSDGYPTNVWITSSAPVVSNCFISKGAYGIRVDGNGTPVLDANDINNCSSAPIVMSVLSDPDIHTNNSYSTNGIAALALLSETMSQNGRIRYRPGIGSPTYAYYPTGTITIASGVTLAVDPQVVLKPSGAYSLFAVNGALNVVGSNNTTGRVIITSRRDDNPLYGGDSTPNDASAPQVGDWGNIAFNDISVDAQCVLRNVLFQFGGSGGNTVGCINTTSASPTIVRDEFFSCATAMTFTGNSTPVVDSTNILNCTQLPIVFSLISNPSFPHPGQVVMANNAFTCLGLLAETIAQDVRTGVRSISGIPNIAYCPTGLITIAFGSKWTIDPGVVIKLGRISSDPIGTSINIDGALVADGKPDSLIVFTSSADDAFGGDVKNDGALTTPAAGQWGGIEFRNISDDVTTVIDNCRFRYAGYGSQGALDFISAGPTITNTFLTSTGGYGALIEGSSTPTFSNCQIDSSTNVPVQMSLASEPVFTNVQWLGNTYTAIGVISEAIAQDLLWRIRPVAGRNNMPYLLQGTLTVGLGSTVTMQPGVIVKMTNSGTIFVQRAFIAEGRTLPDSNIVFTSYRDDFYGGDTNNDGAASSPGDDWSSITIDGTAIDAQCRFRNCNFRYGGVNATAGALRAINSAPTADSCVFAYNTTGISVEGASNPTARGCTFLGNAQFAINNTGNSFCVNAEGSWWGAASGPNDASATADLCGLGLNAGTGDKVSNNVDYQPFATTGVVNALLGDVSLNGQVLAYDASLILQSVVLLYTLNPLQQIVGDVSGNGTVTSFDASLILAYVAGIIRAFPAVSNGMHRAHEEVAAARRIAGESQGTFSLTIDPPVRDGDTWVVAVRASGSAPVRGVDFELVTGGALTAVEAASGALEAHDASGGHVRVAAASALAFPDEVVARLRFAADGATFDTPLVVRARVNEVDLAATTSVPAPAVDGAPSQTRLGAPRPNPATGPAHFELAIAGRDEGAMRVQVLDLAGRVVRELEAGGLPAGVHPMVWNLDDAAGRHVAPGLYFLRARSGAFASSRPIVVVR